MVALSAEQQSKTKFYLEYTLASPAADLARLQRAMNEVPDSWTLTRLGDLISRCDDAYELLELAAGALTSDEQTAITGDVIRTTVIANRDSYNRRQRYFLDCTNYLAKALGVRNFRDPEQVAAAHYLDGGLYINSIPGVDGNDGVDGLSAYQVAVANGFVGTVGDWLDSLTGPAGPGFYWQGSWDSVTGYAVEDVVEYQGSSYFANASNTNKIPGVDPEWDLLAAKGEQGPTGLPGAGIDWKGPWSSATAYLADDGVSYNGSAYIANTGNTNKVPGVASEWDLWVAKGDQGSAGTSPALNPAIFPHIATPSAPSSGNTALYAKPDGLLYYRPAGGSETVVGSGSGGGREVLTADRTYYVRADGSDSNNGLANTAGGAFLTPGKARDVLRTLDGNGYTATVKFNTGTYSLSSQVVWSNFVGFTTIYLEGDKTTPANVVVTSSANISYFKVSGTIPIYIEGFHFTNTGNNNDVCFLNSENGWIYHGFNNYGATTTGSLNNQTHIMSSSDGKVSYTGNYTISGTAFSHLGAIKGSFVYGELPYPTITVTLTGTPNFTNFLNLSRLSAYTIYYTYVTYSGSATGKRYELDSNSVSRTAGGSNYFPGNSAGSVATGGQYI